MEWFVCPCCPPNVARIIASIGNYFYSTGPKDVWVHLFAGNTGELEVNGSPIKLHQQTQYPWDGTVQFTVETEQPQDFTLHLRLPGWCSKYSLQVNGQEQSIQPDAGGYLSIQREWKNGDTVTYVMDMPIQTLYANPAVRQLEGRVAMQRGPVVYCLEGVDHNGMVLDRISVEPEQITRSFTVEYKPELLGGVAVIHGTGCAIEAGGWDETLYRTQPPAEKEIKITAVPYCVWDNREPGEMRVWLRTK